MPKLTVFAASSPAPTYDRPRPERLVAGNPLRTTWEHFLSTTGQYKVVASTGAPITVAREVANSGTQAVRFLTVVQNGVELNGGLNSTGNGNILFYDGEPNT